MKHHLESESPEELRMKRYKVNGDTVIKTRAIVGDDFYKKPAFLEAYFTTVDDKKYIRPIVESLATAVPMNEFRHLKRVRNNDIMICLKSDIAEDGSMERFLEKAGVPDDLIKIICKSLNITLASIDKPLLQWQHACIVKNWPSRFFFDRYKESLYNNTNFSKKEMDFTNKIVRFLYKLEDMDGVSKPIGICVDPRTNSIVAISSSLSDKICVLHCPMVLIDYVGRTQNGGAYNYLAKDEFMEDEIKEDQQITLSGILKKYYEAAKNDPQFKDLEFGAEVQKEPKQNIALMEQKKDNKIDNLEKYGPYICTGYNVYLSQEPCLMCAMALIHSRVKRLFFLKSSDNGCVATKSKLQQVSFLNHRYEVFQCYEV